MKEVIANIAANWPQYLQILLSVVGTAALIAAATPTPKDDTIVAKIQTALKKIADFLGANFGNAKNAE